MAKQVILVPDIGDYTDIPVIEVLGTDGFGRSDTREKLRDFFEVDRRWIVLTALRSLVDSGQMDRQKLAEALKKYEIDTTKPNPMLV